MIPRVAKSGRSFKGAGLYYLHDKNAMTADRVAFVHTSNLPTENPDIAIAHMVDTATHANQLKQASGIKGGRPLQTPVYCYSLAWHPSETPTKAEQLEAVQATLKRLGVADRQAVIIGHNDTDHTHVHVMVNRVCPKTGKASNMGNDRLILSDWALQYRKERGEEHFCPQREENHQRRKGEFVKDQSLTRQEWVAWKKSQTKDIWDFFRADRDEASAPRKGQLDALWRQKEERFALRRDEIKQLYKPIWRDAFQRQKKELRDFDAGMTRRISFALGQPKGKVWNLVNAVMGGGSLRRDFIETQDIERKGIANQQKGRIVDAGREVTKAWKYDRDQLKAMHKAEDDRRYQDTKAKADEVWQDKTLSISGQEFDDKADRRKDTENRENFHKNHHDTGKKPRAKGFLEGQREKRLRNRTRRRPR
jgi:hypothetical protein